MHLVWYNYFNVLYNFFVQYQCTPLHKAAQYNHAGVVTYLLSLPGVSVDARDKVTVYCEESLIHVAYVMHFNNEFGQLLV